MDTVIENQAPVVVPKGSLLSGLAWWLTLIIAVIAVPFFGAVIALAATSSPSGQMLIFMLGCWLSTWLGMWLMRRSHVHHFHWPHHHHK